MRHCEKSTSFSLHLSKDVPLTSQFRFLVRRPIIYTVWATRMTLCGVVFEISGFLREDRYCMGYSHDAVSVFYHTARLGPDPAARLGRTTGQPQQRDG